MKGLHILSESDKELIINIVSSPTPKVFKLVTSLPNEKILDLFKLKAFADMI